MTVNVNKQNTFKSRNEFLQIRILQFLYFSLKEAAARKARFNLNELNSGIGISMVEVLLTQCLDHDSGRLREWGLNCLEAFGELKETREREAEFALFLIGYRGEIIADKE